MGEPSIFGKRLRSARKRREFTQSELAKRADVSPAAISHFETGERKYPSADNLVKIAGALDVTTDYLLGQTEEDEYTNALSNALLRRAGLEDAPDSVLDTIAEVADALIEQEKRGGSNGGSG